MYFEIVHVLSYFKLLSSVYIWVHNFDLFEKKLFYYNKQVNMKDQYCMWPFFILVWNSPFMNPIVYVWTFSINCSNHCNMKEMKKKKRMDKGFELVLSK